HLRYPFSTISAIRGDALFRTDRYVYKSLDVNTLREPNEDQFWFGLKMEYVYDNARERSLNILTGTKLKFFAEHYRQVDEKKTGISIIGFDFRHYHKIHKCMIFAIRGAGSTSFGERKLIYYLGGVDNWIFPKFNGNINIDYSRNYIFQSLATNMRGFPQNIRNGNSFLLWNNELRLPVFRYLFNKPLKSDFLNNFQIIGFSDIGTAWTGLNPYSPENSLFTQVIQQGPIKVTLENLREPIVVGYGFGLRTRLTGYFLRADWGWGWEDGYVMKPLFHLSLGLDF
ncbi:MAG: hypothetical protein KKA07_10430, partial [Bacteroidetes bacterium]|nr:hypothetical protein [Bacteroidota bacterium]